MKNYIYKFSTLIVAVGLLLSCEADNPPPSLSVLNDVDVSNPWLRVLSVDGAIDLFDTNSGVAFEFEFQADDQELLQGVEFFISFRDNNRADGVDFSAGPVSIGSLSPGDFAPGPFGFNRSAYNYTFGEALTALGLDQSQVFGADLLTLDWTMTLTDGRTYDVSDVSGGVGAVGAFYSSPYQFANPVVCLLDPTLFTGDYTLETTATGIFGTTLFPQGVVTIESTGSTTRSFTAAVYPDLGAFDAITFEFELVCDQVVVPGGQVTGVGCGSSTTLGPPDDDDDGNNRNGRFDFTDESTFTINLTDDEAAVCGSAEQVTMVFTKV